MDRLRRMFGIKREETSQDHRRRPLDNGSVDLELEKDCVECRVIGTVVPIGVAAYILYHYRRQRGSYKGLEAAMWNVLCIGVSSAFLLIGGCRAFDYGLFQKDEKARTTPAKT